ncbi:MAG: hypothetical protein ABEK59_03125 [Halobacteria archaeon]
MSILNQARECSQCEKNENGMDFCEKHGSMVDEAEVKPANSL